MLLYTLFSLQQVEESLFGTNKFILLFTLIATFYRVV